MGASLNTWTSIFLLAAAQGMFLTFLILSSRKKRSAANIALSAVVFLFSLILIYCVGFWTGFNNYLPPYINLTLSLTYLIGPVMLFFIGSIHKKKDLSPGLLAQAIPFVIHIILQLIALYLLSTISAQRLTTIITVVQNLHLIIYAIIIVLNSGSNERFWIKHIGWAYMAYSLCFFSYYIMSWTGILKIEYDYIVSFGMTAFIYFVGYYGYHQQFASVNSIEKYRNSGISDSTSKHLFEKLNKYMNADQPFLDHSLKLTDLANQLSLSTHVLSQIINQHANISFSEYVNKFRIEEAIRLLHHEEYKHDKLITIAYDSGFSNKVSFNNAFKKITSQTPTEYRKTKFPPSNMSVAS